VFLPEPWRRRPPLGKMKNPADADRCRRPSVVITFTGDATLFMISRVNPMPPGVFDFYQPGLGIFPLRLLIAVAPRLNILNIIV